MEKFKGTPGPWEYEDGDIWSGDELVTTIIDEFQPKDIHLRNANLIAAAPDLLEALLLFADEEIMAQLNGSEYVDPIDDEEWVRFRFVAKDYRKANAAIARALGKNDGED